MNHVRANLLKLREAKGWSQEKLAQEAELSTMAVVQIETGRRTRPRIDTLNKLAKALGVTVDQLVSSQARRSVTESMAKRSQTDPALLEAAKVLQALAGVGPFRRAIVMYMLFQDPVYLENLPEIGPIQRLLSKVP